MKKKSKYPELGDLIRYTEDCAFYQPGVGLIVSKKTIKEPKWIRNPVLPAASMKTNGTRISNLYEILWSSGNKEDIIWEFMLPWNKIEILNK